MPPFLSRWFYVRTEYNPLAGHYDRDVEDLRTALTATTEEAAHAEAAALWAQRQVHCSPAGDEYPQHPRVVYEATLLETVTA